MLIRALLILVLIMATTFAWRARRQFPGLALFGAVVATMAGTVLLRWPAAAAMGLLAAALLIAWLSRPPE